MLLTKLRESNVVGLPDTEPLTGDLHNRTLTLKAKDLQQMGIGYAQVLSP